MVKKSYRVKNEEYLRIKYNITFFLLYYIIFLLFLFMKKYILYILNKALFLHFYFHHHILYTYTVISQSIYFNIFIKYLLKIDSKINTKNSYIKMLIQAYLSNYKQIKFALDETRWK